MKRPVEWHEHCLANAEMSAAKKWEQVQSLKDDAARTEIANLFRREQIAEAKRRGITEFDGDKFNVKRKQKAPQGW